MNNEVNDNTQMGMENNIPNNQPTDMENNIPNNSPIETGSNIPDNAPQKKSGIAKIIIIILAVLVVAGGIAFAVVKFSKNKEEDKTTAKIDKVAVYSNAISSSFDKINQLVDNLDGVQEKFKIEDKALYFTGDMKIDTNLQELQSAGIDFSKYKLDFAFGLDVKNKQIQLGAGLNDTLKAQLYYKNNRVYLISDVLENPVDITKELKSEIGSSSFEILTSSFTELNKTEQLQMMDTTKKITKILEKIITEAIDKDKIEQQESGYEVNGTKVDATKLTLTLDGKTLKEIVEKLVDEIKNDDELLSGLASMMDVSKSEIKDALKSIDTSDIELDKKMLFNVYVQKGETTATGLNIIMEDEELLSYYTYDGSLILTINDDEESMILKTEKKGNDTNFSLRVGSEEIMSGTVRDFSNDKIDFDITVNDEGEKVSISIYMTANKTNSSISGDYKFKLSMNNEYIGVTGKYSLESKDKLEDINVSNAVTSDSIDGDKLLTNIQNKIASNADLKTLFELLFY